LMLDKWMLRIKERFTGHKSFLPQDTINRHLKEEHLLIWKLSKKMIILNICSCNDS
jgi:hypothetical protein